MRIFDPHIHCFSRTTDDYERMALSGIRIVNEPAFWLGQPRTSVGTFVDYFETLIGWERFRASQYGIKHVCTLALNPKEANDPRVQGILDLMPEYLAKEGVMGVGEIGYDDMTKAEEEAFTRQLQMAQDAGLIVIIHTPHRDKKEGVIRTIDTVKSMNLEEEKIVIDHNTEETVQLVKDRTNCWAGHTLYPQTKMSIDRAVKIVERYGTEKMLFNSSADWGLSDPLNLPKLAFELRKLGHEEQKIERLLWTNPIEFMGQSGKLDLSELDLSTAGPVDVSALFEGSSIQRS